MDRYTDALATLKKDEAAFCSFIRSSFSEEAHILLRSDPRYNDACMSSSSYDLFLICLELHSCSNSFSVAQSTLVSLFASPWPGTLNQLKDELLNSRHKISAMFDPAGTGMVKIDDLFVVAFLNALPDKHFSYPKDKIFAENTAKTLPDFFKTLETMTNFDHAVPRVQFLRYPSWSNCSCCRHSNPGNVNFHLRIVPKNLSRQ